MSQIQCHICHTSIDADDRFCSSCGAKLVKASNGKGAVQQQQQINHMPQNMFNDINAHRQHRQAEQDQVQHRMHNILQGVQDAVDDQGNLYQVNYGAYKYYGDGSKAYGLGFWDQPNINWHPLKLTGD